MKLDRSAAGPWLSALEQRLLALSDRLSQPDNARRLRTLVIVLALVWMAFGLARLFWALFPAAPTGPAEPVQVINPQSVASVSGRPPVNIEMLRSWHLFGEANVKVDTAALARAQEAEAQRAREAEREGIEKNARDTRLALVLRGVVASDIEGQGHAIIEHQKKQQVYGVDDSLPGGNRVTLAKVLSDRVVLDNGGTYELLKLFRDDGLSAQVKDPVQKPALKSADQAAMRSMDKRGDADITALATGYRERLYQNPQSLTDAVKSKAVRGEGGLRGYQVQPGSEPEQFKQMGFRNGDIVTGVNGVVLNNPGKAMQLYQTLRTATQAEFTLQRNDAELTLTVSLETPQG